MPHAGQGGRQFHSIGEDYPFTVVGTIINDRTFYYVMNLVTGERDDILFTTSEWAHNHAQDCKAAERERRATFAHLGLGRH